MDRIAIGQQTEQMALRYLQEKGLRHEESNYRCRQGEIDLVMSDGSTLVFVEVRYRKSGLFGSAAETIDRRKQHKLTCCARHYLSTRNKLKQACRFDVVSMDGPLSALQIDWIRDAFIT